jgi:hypothetical protein
VDHLAVNQSKMRAKKKLRRTTLLFHSQVNQLQMVAKRNLASQYLVIHKLVNQILRQTILPFHKLINQPIMETSLYLELQSLEHLVIKQCKMITKKIINHHSLYLDKLQVVHLANKIVNLPINSPLHSLISQHHKEASQHLEIQLLEQHSVNNQIKKQRNLQREVTNSKI